jgi:hypothetical protein
MMATMLSTGRILFPIYSRQLSALSMLTDVGCYRDSGDVFLFRFSSNFSNNRGKHQHWIKRVNP